MENVQNVYDDGETKVELSGYLQHFYETDKLLLDLDIYQRIRILEFVAGIRDITEVQFNEVEIVKRVLEERLIGHVSPELDPSTWNLPETHIM